MDEKSAGAVVFRESTGGRRYLLLQNAGRWDFPKGGIEKGESELETVLREVKEESGIDDLEMIPGFRKVIEYFYRREGKNVHKQVVYLLGRTDKEKIKISFEHQGFGWFSFRDAVTRASYDNSKNTLNDAEKFLKSGTGEARTGPAGEAPGASPL
ncbi:MAG TPA: NUDIX domain-containing protein [Nitrososphaerales archaeon]|nr:NUDIX domain-containing protein [Nitrososphaerales archaeon]